MSLRSQPGSLALLKTMEGIYRMLALYHPAGHYGSTYDQMANFRGLLDDVALARTLPSSRRTYKIPPPRLAATVHTLLSRARFVVRGDTGRYHLTFGSDDQTHYSLAYEVARRKKGGLLYRDRTTLTSAQTRYTGQRRTAHETILLDLGEVKGTRELEVIVRVTDETTGQMVERSLDFDVREE